MIILITGATHTGKTLLAQKLLEKYKYPYLCADHIKMGLIRSGNTELTPLSSIKELTDFLWPVIREIIKTAIENKQNLIVEGCYIPLDYKKDFSSEYFDNITCYCLVMSKNYIDKHFDDIIRFGNVIEMRIADDATKELLIAENAAFLNNAEENGIRYILIDEKYNPDSFLI